MPPRPRSPRIRYRPPSIAPGGKRPSSTTDELPVSWEMSDATAAAARATGSTTVSATDGVGSRSIEYDSTTRSKRELEEELHGVVVELLAHFLERGGHGRGRLRVDHRTLPPVALQDLARGRQHADNPAIPHGANRG